MKSQLNAALKTLPMAIPVVVWQTSFFACQHSTCHSCKGSEMIDAGLAMQTTTEKKMDEAGYGMQQK